jgi:transposase
MDESYFGGKRKYDRGRSTKSKIPVFGLLKRNGKVYTQIVPDVSQHTLMKIIRSKVITNSKVYTDSWRSYDGLIIKGYKHHRINHSKEFSRGKCNHINGIESFWSYTKGKL